MSWPILFRIWCECVQVSWGLPIVHHFALASSVKESVCLVTDQHSCLKITTFVIVRKLLRYHNPFVRACLSVGLLDFCLLAAVVCPKPTNPDNGRAIFTSLTYGSTVTYECHHGFTIKGPPSARCNAKREWHGGPSTCVGELTAGQRIYWRLQARRCFHRRPYNPVYWRETIIEIEFRS